jgi:hypothetical protein
MEGGGSGETGEPNQLKIRVEDKQNKQNRQNEQKEKERKMTKSKEKR